MRVISRVLVGIASAHKVTVLHHAHGSKYCPLACSAIIHAVKLIDLLLIYNTASIPKLAPGLAEYRLVTPPYATELDDMQQAAGLVTLPNVVSASLCHFAIRKPWDPDPYACVTTR